MAPKLPWPSPQQVEEQVGAVRALNKLASKPWLGRNFTLTALFRRQAEGLPGLPEVPPLPEGHLPSEAVLDCPADSSQAVLVKHEPADQPGDSLVPHEPADQPGDSLVPETSRAVAVKAEPADEPGDSLVEVVSHTVQIPADEPADKPVLAEFPVPEYSSRRPTHDDLAAEELLAAAVEVKGLAVAVRARGRPGRQGGWKPGPGRPRLARPSIPGEENLSGRAKRAVRRAVYGQCRWDEGPVKKAEICRQITKDFKNLGLSKAKMWERWAAQLGCVPVTVRKMWYQRAKHEAEAKKLAEQQGAHPVSGKKMADLSS